MGKYSRKICGVDGIERTFTFKPLDVAAAIDLEDELWRAFSEFLGNSGPEAAAIFGDAGNTDAMKAGMSALSAVPASLLGALSKDRLRHMSKVLLSGCQITDPSGNLLELRDGWADEYLVGRWPERLEALVGALDVSFPGYFSKARAYIADFAKRRLSRIFSKAKSTESLTE